MALNYGGRADIVRAAKLALKNGQVLTEENLAKNLYCDVDVDFVIRTSGEMRISNFMLYQMAYSELHFPKKYWPDFNEKEFVKTLKVYQKRRRRYGGV